MDLKRKKMHVIIKPLNSIISDTAEREDCWVKPK